MPLFIYLLVHTVYLKIEISSKEFFYKEIFFIIALGLNAGNFFNSKEE